MHFQEVITIDREIKTKFDFLIPIMKVLAKWFFDYSKKNLIYSPLHDATKSISSIYAYMKQDNLSDGNFMKLLYKHLPIKQVMYDQVV